MIDGRPLPLAAPGQSTDTYALRMVSRVILPPEVFRLPRFGAVNIHPSLLPSYRGPAPVLWAIGFTPVHDRGRVLAEVAVTIGCGGRDLVEVGALRAKSGGVGR